MRSMPSLFSPRADFLLKVRGLSMIDAGIFDGDLLAVHKTSQARDGQIVIARLDEEVTVKRLSARRPDRTDRREPRFRADHRQSG
jgi:SOS-response transcriptional repressor LexA